MYVFTVCVCVCVCVCTAAVVSVCVGILPGSLAEEDAGGVRQSGSSQ